MGVERQKEEEGTDACRKRVRSAARPEVHLSTILVPHSLGPVWHLAAGRQLAATPPAGEEKGRGEQGNERKRKREREKERETKEERRR
jgi:hypothetical protein